MLGRNFLTGIFFVWNNDTPFYKSIVNIFNKVVIEFYQSIINIFNKIVINLVRAEASSF